MKKLLLFLMFLATPAYAIESAVIGTMFKQEDTKLLPADDVTELDVSGIICTGCGGGVSEGSDVGFGNITATSLQVGEGVTTLFPTLDEATGDEAALSIEYTTNKATSGNDTGLKINMTDTASPGTSKLLDLRHNDVRVFSVAEDGTTFSAGSVRATTLISSIIDSAAANQTIVIQQNRVFNNADNGIEMIPGIMTQGTGEHFNGIAIIPTYNQTDTASATDLLINRKQTAVGSGDQLLIDAQVDDVSKFSVDNAGSTHSKGSLNIFNGTTVFTNYSVTTQDYTIFANATTTGTTMYLPDATTVEGIHLRFKKKDDTSNHITINAVGGQNIDGNGSKVLEQTNNAIMVYSDGSNWEVLQATSVAHYGEMHVHGNSTATDISTTNIPHLMQGLFAEEDTEGFTFVAGSTGPIAAFAEYSTVVSGTTKVTDANHGLSSGAILSINGTTSYNGIFKITVIDASNYYIIATFVADDATGNWYEGDKLVNTTGKTAKYMVEFHGFGTPETNNDIIEFHLYKDAIVLANLESKGKFTSSTDVKPMSASGLVTLADNEAVTFAITNTTGTGDFTMEHVNMVIQSF